MNSSEAYKNFEVVCLHLGARTATEVNHQLVLGNIAEEVIVDLLVFAPEKLTDIMAAAINRGYGGNLGDLPQTLLDRLMRDNPVTKVQINQLFIDAMSDEMDRYGDYDQDYDDFDGPSIIDDGTYPDHDDGDWDDYAEVLEDLPDDISDDDWGDFDPGSDRY